MYMSGYKCRCRSVDFILEILFFLLRGTTLPLLKEMVAHDFVSWMHYLKRDI